MGGAGAGGIIGGMMDQTDDVAGVLGSAVRVLITTHVRPDGDALGSAAALAMGLAGRGVEIEVLLLSHLPSKYAFIFNDHGIVHHDAEAGWPAGLDLGRFDVLAVVDTGTWAQLPGLRERLDGFAGKKVVVDHHLTQEDWADVKWVDTAAAAAGEIVAELLAKLGVGIDGSMATALYLAIASDTGWFQFSNTSPRTLRLAADLMERGVDTDRLYQLLYQNERAERVVLQARALGSLELLCDNRLAVMVIRQADFQATGAKAPDTENLINIPLQIATVEVSVLVTEATDFGPTRVSLRSKGGVDVARFAEGFGGGGHARASGLKIEDTVDGARDKVVAAMERKLGVGCKL